MKQKLTLSQKLLQKLSELEENKYTEEDLEEIIKMCTSIAKVDEFSKEDKLVIARLRKVFGLKK